MTAAPDRRVKLPRLEDRLELGRSGLRVSPICLGMVRDPDTVPFAFDSGINFFFVTGDLHWPYYEQLRRGLAALLDRGSDVRDRIVVAAVSYLSRPDQLRIPFLEVLEAIPRLERLDVLVAGWAVGDDDPARRERFTRYRSEGFVGCRAVGATFHDRTVVAKACNEQEVDIAYVRYNAAHTGAKEEVFPHRGQTTSLLYGFRSVYGFMSNTRLDAVPSLPRDIWRPSVPDHYRFCLTPREMDGLLCSPQTPDEVRALSAALAEDPLTEEEEGHLIDLARLGLGEAEIVDAEPAGVAG